MNALGMSTEARLLRGEMTLNEYKIGKALSTEAERKIIR